MSKIIQFTINDDFAEAIKSGGGNVIIIITSVGNRILWGAEIKEQPQTSLPTVLSLVAEYYRNMSTESIKSSAGFQLSVN